MLPIVTEAFGEPGCAEVILGGGSIFLEELNLILGLWLSSTAGVIDYDFAPIGAWFMPSAANKTSFRMPTIFIKILSMNAKSMVSSLLILISPFTICAKSTLKSFRSYLAWATNKVLANSLDWGWLSSRRLMTMKNLVLPQDSSISNWALFGTIISCLCMIFLSEGMSNCIAFIGLLAFISFAVNSMDIVNKPLEPWLTNWPIWAAGLSNWFCEF